MPAIPVLPRFGGETTGKRSKVSRPPLRLDLLFTLKALLAGIARILADRYRLS